jgi:hypothetical protein
MSGVDIKNDLFLSFARWLPIDRWSAIGRLLLANADDEKLEATTCGRIRSIARIWEGQGRIYSEQGSARRIGRGMPRTEQGDLEGRLIEAKKRRSTSNVPMIANLSVGVPLLDLIACRQAGLQAE